MPRLTKPLLCALSSLLVAACGTNSNTPTTTGSGNPAPTGLSPTGKAYEALTAGAQNEITQVIADVDDAVAKDPSDGRANFYAATMRFWQLGEEIDLPSSPADLVTEARTTIDRFRTAQSLLPDDDRAPAFGGLAKSIIGNILSDSAMQAEGLSDIQHGIDIFPAYS